MTDTACQHEHLRFRYVSSTAGDGPPTIEVGCAHCGTTFSPADHPDKYQFITTAGAPPPLPLRELIDRIVASLPVYTQPGYEGKDWVAIEGEDGMGGGLPRETVREALYRAAGVIGHIP